MTPPHWPATAIESDEDQWVTELHESLHRGRFQKSTPWAVLARVAVDVAAAGVDPGRLQAMASSCNRYAKTVHEAYATYLSLHGDRDHPPVTRRHNAYRRYMEYALRIAAACRG